MNRNLLGFLLFIIAVGLGVGVVWPQINEVRLITTDRNAKRTVLETKKQRLKDLQTIQATFATDPERINRLITTLPPEPQIQELLVTIENMGQSSGVNISSVVPQVDTRQQKVLLTLVGDGDVFAVEKLIAAIGDNNRPMSVEGITINRAQDVKRVSYSLTVNAPYSEVKSTQKGQE